jgi:peptidoglycan/LPS O-acetylase OafA/YrhL
VGVSVRKVRLHTNENSVDAKRYELLRSGRRIPELDGLRGVAITLVLYNHMLGSKLIVRRFDLLWFFQAPTRLSWSGVDLFFVLSGFLIGGILMDARKASNYFQIFYVRRACRILPPYLALLGATALGYYYLYPRYPSQLSEVYAGLFPWYAYLTFTSNLWMIRSNPVVGASLGIIWSLAVEEQFYLTLPAIVRNISKRNLRFVIVGGILVAPVTRALLLLLNPALRFRTYVLLPCRMDSLLIGVLVAYVLRQENVWNRIIEKRKWVWRLFAILILGLGYFNINPLFTSTPMILVGYDWLALFYATALLIILIEPQSLLAGAMRWPWLMWMGTLAYGMYLIHGTVDHLCMLVLRGQGSHVENLYDFVAELATVGVTIGVAKLSWHFFEKPLIRWGHKMKYESPLNSKSPSLTVSSGKAIS